MNFVQFSNHPQVGTFLFLVLFIFIVFRLLHYAMTKYYKTETRQIFSKALYLIECIFWFVVLYQGIILFKSKNMVFSAFCFIILLIAVAWSTWFVLKDYLAGLYLKIDGAFRLNETIEFDGYIGKIIKIGSRVIELELNSSKIVLVPFHQFFIKRIIYTGATGNCAKENFVFKLNPKYDAIESLEKIKIYIQQLPWISNKYEQEVLIEKSDRDGTFIKINASLFDKKYFYSFRQMISKRFE